MRSLHQIVYTLDENGQGVAITTLTDLDAALQHVELDIGQAIRGGDTWVPAPAHEAAALPLTGRAGPPMRATFELTAPLLVTRPRSARPLAENPHTSPLAQYIMDRWDELSHGQESVTVAHMAKAAGYLNHDLKPAPRGRGVGGPLEQLPTAKTLAWLARRRHLERLESGQRVRYRRLEGADDAPR